MSRVTSLRIAQLDSPPGIGQHAPMLENYDPNGSYCEMFGGAGIDPVHTRLVRQRLESMGIADLRRRARAAEAELYNLGITFTVYTNREAIDRILPFDVIPRLLSPEDWRTIESGVKQRVAALNLFLHDLYHDRKILKDRLVPADLVLGNKNYRPEMEGVDVPHGT